MNTIRDLRAKYHPNTVLLAAPGPSLEMVAAIHRASCDMVIGVNLAVERFDCDLWFVIDNPLRIRKETKRERFFAVDRGLPLATPFANRGGWTDREPYFFDVTDPFHDNCEAIGSLGQDRLPSLPAFSGAPFAAAALALYLGAKRIVLAGVDYHGTIHSTAEQIRRITTSWLLLSRAARLRGALIEQGNMASMLKLS